MHPLVRRLEALAAGRARVMVGLTGAPGVGKSTLADRLAGALPCGQAVVVGMDGFHLAAEVIAGTPLQDRRGAIDTFDAGGFRDLLRRVRERADEVVYAPRYERRIEDPIAAAVPVPRSVRYVVVEGNWLLAATPPWRDARACLDEVWFLDADPDLRRSRLVARHVQFGKSGAEARRWTHGSDEVNARTVADHRAEADLVIDVGQL